MAEEKINKKIKLNITTPRGLKFDQEADMIIMRCIDGNLGVLPSHEPVSTVLGDGILRIFNNGAEMKLAIFGGIAEIGDETVNIFSTIAQRPEEIDLERAEKDRMEAEALILEETEELQVQSSQVLLRRSLVRIEVSLHLGSNGYFDDEDDDIDDDTSP